MKTKFLAKLLFLFILITACSSSINYSDDFKAKTSGKYLFNADDIITISYDDNDLYLNWRGVKIKPVVTDTNEFFVPDLYQKLHFVQHPDTKSRYLSVISETNPDSLSYDYLKVANNYKTPSEHLADKNFDKALEGFLAIKEKDSVSDFINQYKFNRLGYKYFREKNYDDAIGVFIMNTKLHPNSPNVYDSLGQAYLVSGDSLRAYKNYKKAYELNRGNKRAKKYIDAYESSLD
ncbi:MAG: tetratricopeptide repeat protein [Winogradskyella sp.]|uniref:tetratricopeptide repeat protein n=1 Tax=Winogradskyella sp. TaxID=1883156 RepID=UPI0017F2D727|nr:tetratricopeptide repeat protein [Winogradskyella sp.]MBT8243771.1 tetratricopeptide repeat protein [Winogradskyella sp.]NNK22037.1 tetratricopeptide repeat protein [Winogradskyella sp.]